MSKDWTGSKRSSFATLGASNHSDHERQQEDYYATDPATIQPLLDMMTKHNERMPRRIWENASGENHLVDELKKIGYTVLPSDIAERTERTIKYDFLGEYFLDMRNMLGATDGEEVGILTNPPYKYAKEWVERAMTYLRHKEKLIMFLKIQFLEGKARHRMFKKYPPKYVFVFSSRQKCAMNGKFDDSSSAACYCWYVWEKDFKGSPIIDWIK